MKNNSRYFFSKVLPAVILIFLSVTILSTLYPYFQFDLLISKYIQNINSQAITSFLWIISYLGNYPLMIIIVGVICTILYLRNLRAEAIISSLTTAGGALSGSLIKVLSNRPRPSGELVSVQVWLADNSYPSNHVLVFTVFMGFFIYLIIRQKVSWPRIILSLVLFISIILVGVSRIYLGAHWASDVFGGFLLGLLWLLLAIKLYNSHHAER